MSGKKAPLVNTLSILLWGLFKRSAHVMCRTFWSGSVGFLGSRWPIGALFLFGDWQTDTCSNSHVLVARFCGSLLLQRLRGWKSFSTHTPSPSPCPMLRHLFCQTKNWFGFFGKWRMHACQRWCQLGPAKSQANALAYPECMWKAALKNTHLHKHIMILSEVVISKYRAQNIVIRSLKTTIGLRSHCRALALNSDLLLRSIFF